MASSSSVSVPQLMKDEEPINWAELPQELLSSILLRLGMVKILLSAQKVCRSWQRVCKDPSMWRKFDIEEVIGHQNRDLDGLCRQDPSMWQRALDFDGLCRQAVDLSQGGMLEINISHFNLLSYIADRSGNLRSLELKMMSVTNEELVNAIVKLPLLETVSISSSMFKLDLKAIGEACTQLQTLKLGYMHFGIECDDDYYALAIAENMLQLRHLQLIGNRLTDTGLNVILDNLPHLKHLDLRMCYKINLVGILEKRCVEKIKELRRPNDSMADCPFDVIYASSESDYDSDIVYDDYYIDDFYFYGQYIGTNVLNLLRKCSDRLPFVGLSTCEFGATTNLFIFGIV